MTKVSQINASTEWRSPSNLAIVKYWGKRNVQEPINPSVSFSLKNSVTITRVTATPLEKGGFTFSLNGVFNPAFHPKIETFLKQAQHHLPFIRNHHLTIESSNTFPHSSGIASSASSMSALALCLLSLHNLSIGKSPESVDLTMASGLSRFGSGSACRSVFGGWSLWGKFDEVKESSDTYAVPIPKNVVSPVFQDLKNAILIINSGSKSVSSSQGHQLMNQHPYREARVEQAFNHTGILLEILKTGDWDGFIETAENEALTLHGLMLNSSPSYTLMEPNSLQAIRLIRQARTDENLKIGFSMDAGPNLHVLYPASEVSKVESWIEENLKPLCQNQQIIYDSVGDGPINIQSINNTI
ncbi:diphosphomevalonate decarboxylase [Natronoflexus pectinivorans]|uniref:diphosphomevalonate decarboxylase n=1 Tax=Natronoflexus pectinivorans TaxID=682526 RepID=A0A4R2GDH1_9BACT|nr:diphosphomevalonate decarboxylase [Natronoflexus pectinivorans]TCO06148.1 diphosphomevalonate decarboxylase [Natronoflexus pectinivorans]